MHVCVGLVGLKCDVLDGEVSAGDKIKRSRVVSRLG